MIGRVLAFVACVALVTAETCNGENGTTVTATCCAGTDFKTQRVNAGTQSFEAAEFITASSGFVADEPGKFDIAVKIHHIYYKAGSKVLNPVDFSEYKGLPIMEIADMGTAKPAGDKAETSGGAAPADESTGCFGTFTRRFRFSQVSGGTSGNPNKIITGGSTISVYAGVNVIMGAKVWGEVYQTEYVERIAVELISFYFQFTKTVDVTATSTVTYAKVDINVVLTQSSVTALDLLSFVNAVKADGTACTTTKSTACGAAFCDVNPEIQLEVGITTITNLPFMTVLRMHGDAEWEKTHTSTVPDVMGIKISAADLNSGLQFDNTDKDGAAQDATQRVGYTADQVPTTCNGTCTLGNCTAKCVLKYKALLVYRRDKRCAVSNGYTPGTANAAGDDNFGNTNCHITGAILTVGSHGCQGGVGAGTKCLDGNLAGVHQELQCRSKVDSTTYLAAEVTCPFAPDGQDDDDDFTAVVKISTSDWCPATIADNSVVGHMVTSHDSYFDGNRLDVTVYVRGSDGSLPITEVKWAGLYGQCAANTLGDCNVGGDGTSASVAGTNKVHLIPTDAHTLNVVAQVKGSDADIAANKVGVYDGCNKADADDLSNATSGGKPYHCQIEASFYLCQKNGFGVAPYNSPTSTCPHKGDSTATETAYNALASAFEIEDGFTSTQILLFATVSVGYEGIAARKSTIELKGNSEKMYALLQSTEGAANAEIEAGISRVPTDNLAENVDAPIDIQDGVEETVAVEEESNPMLIYIIVGVFLFISVFVGALVMYLRRSKGEKKQDHPVPITVEANKNTAAMA